MSRRGPAREKERVLIQDFTPLSCGIDWELGRLYWEEAGARAFTGGDVPYIANNDGSLSVLAAALLHASLDAAGRSGAAEPRILVVEAGCGLGLFARFFLDAFRDLCRERGTSYYERLCYVCLDSSARMLADLERSGMLAAHRDRCQLLRGDVLSPGWGIEAVGAVHAIFLNYLLDTLPATVLRFSAKGAAELAVRTWLAAGTVRGRRKLGSLRKFFQRDFDYLPADAVRYLEVAEQCASDAFPCVLHSFGAIDCLAHAFQMLGDGGFVLMNDLCARPLDQPFASFCYQLYGGSTAIPVNFPLLECWARRQHGAAWFQPFEDTAPLRHRLLTREPAPETIERFRRDFSKTAREQLKDRAVRAARLREEGHPDEALELYRQALLEQPYNWFLRKEAAALLLDDKQDCAGALLMVKSALDLNPLDVGAWIIAGVSLHRLGRLDGARKAFLRALKSNPRHVEARYHLSLTLAGQGNYERALRVIAEALSEDRTGEDRDRLLARQSEILEAFQAHSQ